MTVNRQSMKSFLHCLYLLTLCPSNRGAVDNGGADVVAATHRMVLA
jgi:hypothetical protein